MIKTIAAAQLRPGKRSLEEFQRYWAENHGPLVSNSRRYGYVQHVTLPEAYSGTPTPTFDGISVMYYDDDEVRNPSMDPWDVRMRQIIVADDRQLFDRDVSWPTDHKRATVYGEEIVVLDGEAQPSNVKLLMVVLRRPGLTRDEFYDHWLNVNGALAAKLPGLRRYTQIHGVKDADSYRPMTHDGWSEMWFDDLASLHAAWASPEGLAMRADGEHLFAEPMAIGIARERIQKWPGHPPKDWGARGLSEQQIKERLERDGYTELASDPKAIASIKVAADGGRDLLIWTDQHLVVNTDPIIDARPSK
jgi:uncharacterized protein (TIGR02118 family)